MDYDSLYTILTDISRRRIQITYTELSQVYHAATGEWVEPFGGWDEALGELNQKLFSANHHPLSAVVVLKETLEPGGRFWESSPNVPRRPANRDSRTEQYCEILRNVHGQDWPATFPSLS